MTSVGDLLVAASGIALLVAAVLFARRAGVQSLLYLMLTFALYLIYYFDRVGDSVSTLHAYLPPVRQALTPLKILDHPDLLFKSSLVPAAVIALAAAAGVVARIRMADREGMFFIGVSIFLLLSLSAGIAILGGIIVSAYGLGVWGAVIYALLAALLYISFIGGVLGQLGKLARALLFYLAVQLRRLWRKFSTNVSAILAYIAVLSERLAPDLRALISRVDTAARRAEKRIDEEEGPQLERIRQAGSKERSRRKRRKDN